MSASSRLICALFLSACAGGYPGETQGPYDSAAPGADSGDPDTTDTALETIRGPAAWVGLSGKVDLTESGVNLRLTLSLFEEQNTEEVLCTVESVEEGLALQEISPDESIAYWWSSKAFALVDMDSCEGADRLPSPLQFGLGDLHESVVPYLVGQGTDAHTPSDGVFGAYIGFNEAPANRDTPGTAFVLGAAHLQDHDGSELVALPSEGSFELDGVFLFPLKELNEDSGLPSNQ